MLKEEAPSRKKSSREPSPVRFNQIPALTLAGNLLGGAERWEITDEKKGRKQRQLGKHSI